MIGGNYFKSSVVTNIEGLTPTNSNFIVGDGTNWVAESGATARTSLGLGTIATYAGDQNLETTSTPRFSRLGMGVSPDANARIKTYFSANTNQYGHFAGHNDNSEFVQVSIFGSSAGAYGEIKASTAFVNTNGADLLFLADNAAGVIRFAIGATGGIERARISSNGGFFLSEIAAADTDIAGKGQIWVKNTTPNELWFTDDAGTDHQIAFA